MIEPQFTADKPVLRVVPDTKESQERDEPKDGYGAGFIEYSIRTSFRDLCRLVGFENARAEVAEIINSEAGRKSRNG